jgi:hypothetical protein
VIHQALLNGGITMQCYYSGSPAFWIIEADDFFGQSIVVHLAVVRVPAALIDIDRGCCFGFLRPRRVFGRRWTRLDLPALHGRGGIHHADQENRPCHLVAF